MQIRESTESVNEEEIKKKTLEFHQNFGHLLNIDRQQLQGIIKEIEQNKYSTVGFLGRRDEEVIFLAQDNNYDGHYVAVKRVKVQSQEQINLVVQIMQKLKDMQFILSLKNGFYSFDKEHYYYVTENTGLNLEQIIQNLKEMNLRWSLKEAIDFAQQMISAFSSLAKLRIFHSKINPQNIQRAQGNYKLCGFGCSQAIQNTENPFISNCNRVDNKYFSPEILSLIPKFNEKSDIYSLGIVFVEITKGDFLTNEEACSIRIRQNDDILNEILSKNEQFIGFNKIIKKMLDINMNNRLDLWSLKNELNMLTDNNFYTPQQQNDIQRCRLIQSYFMNNFTDNFEQLIKIRQPQSHQSMVRQLNQFIENQNDLNSNGIVLKYAIEEKIYFSLLGLNDAFFYNLIIHGYIELVNDFPYNPPQIVIQSDLMHPYLKSYQGMQIVNIDTFKDEWPVAFSGLNKILQTIQYALNDSPQKQINDCAVFEGWSVQQIYVENSENNLSIDEFIQKLQSNSGYSTFVKDKCDC